MSAARNLPPIYEDQPPQEPRRRNWKKIVAWTFGGIGILIVVLVVSAVVVVHTQWFRNYLLNTAEQKLSAALNTQVRASRFNLSWSGISPTVDLYDVSIAGAAPYPTPALLRLQHMHLAIRITSILGRQWNIQDLTLDQPVVHVYVDAKGNSNIPTMSTAPSNSSNNTSVFTLGVRHAALNNGEMYYNDIKSAMSADLHDLHLQSQFVVGQSEYTGNLGYSNGVVKMAGYNPLPNSLEAHFTATPTKFVIDNAVVTSGQSRITLTATMENYSNPVITAHYDASLNSGEFAKILKNPSLPAGTIHANGNLAYHPEANKPMMAGITGNGTISSPELAVRSPQFNGNVRNLGANYRIANGNLDVNNLRADVLGGKLTGNLDMTGLASNNPHSTLNAQLNGASLAQLKGMAKTSSPALNGAAITGTASANVHATWGKTMNDLVAQSNINVRGSMKPAGGGAAVPLSGQIHAQYNGATGQLALNHSQINAGAMSINLNGGISTHSALSINMHGVDLAQLATMATSFGVKLPPNLGLAGVATFTGLVSGSTSAPHIVGDLLVNGLQFKGTQWRMLRTHINASPSQAALQNGDLLAMNGGQIQFNLSTTLRDWSFTNTSPFQAGLNVSSLDLAPLAKAFAPSMPVSGVLNANLKMSGTELAPLGNGTLSLSNANVDGQPIQSLNARLNSNGQVLNATLNTSLPAGSVNGQLAYNTHQQTFTADLRAPNMQLGQLAAVKARGMDLKGVLNLALNGSGSIHNPDLSLTANIPTLDVNGQKISALALSASLQNHLARFDLASQIVNTPLRAQGTVQTVGNYLADITINTPPVPLQPLLAVYAPSMATNLSGQTELHATLRGPLKFPKQVEAHVQIPQLSLNYKNTVKLAAAQPINIDYVNGVARIARSSITGTDTNLQFEGTIPVTTGGAPQLLLVGTVNLAIAQLFSPDITSSGQLQFNINSAGPTSNPNVEGQIRIVNANFATGDVPIGLQGGNGVLTLTRDRLDITQFTATVGGGTVNASGGIVYRPSLHFELALAGNDMRMLIPGGIRSAFNANLALTGTPTASSLRGNVSIAQLQFTPEFDLMNFMGSMGGNASPAVPGGGFMSGLNLNVGVNSTGGLNLVSRTVSAQGSVNLRVVGTAEDPVILGRIVINGGDLIILGNRYVLQHGTIDLINPSQTEPVLNVEANTDINQYNIQIRMWGPADHLHTSYASVPALPPSDIINLIAFGKTTEAQANASNAPGNLGAESLVASQVSSQVTSRLEKIAGISQLTIDPELGGNGKTPGARIAIQQRVTGKIYVTFSTDVTSTQDTIIRLEYHQSPRTTFSGTRDQNGGFGFETKIKKSW